MPRLPESENKNGKGQGRKAIVYCPFCGEWIDVEDINEDDDVIEDCPYCLEAINVESEDTK